MKIARVLEKLISIHGTSSFPMEFTGVGTVLISEIINAGTLAESLASADWIAAMEQCLNSICDSVLRHSGGLLRFVGDTVVAFWAPRHTNPNHAQLAFNASCEILASVPDLLACKQHARCELQIVLGTGDMAGAFLGPTREYQIVGKAMIIAERLSNARDSRRSLVRMSQYTVDLINTPVSLEETGSIHRENLEDLRIFTYRPANQSAQDAVA